MEEFLNEFEKELKGFGFTNIEILDMEIYLLKSYFDELSINRNHEIKRLLDIVYKYDVDDNKRLKNI